MPPSQLQTRKKNPISFRFLNKQIPYLDSSVLPSHRVSYTTIWKKNNFLGLCCLIPYTTLAFLNTNTHQVPQPARHIFFWLVCLCNLVYQISHKCWFKIIDTHVSRHFSLPFFIFSIQNAASFYPEGFLQFLDCDQRLDYRTIATHGFKTQLRFAILLMG